MRTKISINTIISTMWLMERPVSVYQLAKELDVSRSFMARKIKALLEFKGNIVMCHQIKDGRSISPHYRPVDMPCTVVKHDVNHNTITRKIAVTSQEYSDETKEALHRGIVLLLEHQGVPIGFKRIASSGRLARFKSSAKKQGLQELIWKRIVVVVPDLQDMLRVKYALASMVNYPTVNNVNNVSSSNGDRNT